MNLRAATSSHQPFTHPQSSQKPSPHPSSLAPHPHSSSHQLSSHSPHPSSHPSRPQKQPAHASSRSLPPHSASHPSRPHKQPGHASSIPPHSATHPSRPHKQPGHASSLPPQSATHPSRPQKQPGHASSLPPHSATHPLHAVAPSSYQPLHPTTSHGHIPSLQTTQSAPSTPIAPYVPQQPFSATTPGQGIPSIASPSKHHPTSLTAPSTPTGQQRYGQRPNIIPTTPIHPSKIQSHSANNNLNIIARKYGLPMIDFATPLEPKVTRHNLSHYTERETTSYTPTKITKTAPRKGI